MLAACAAGGLGRFSRDEIVVSGQVWSVAVADDAEERAQGLMGVEDLGGLRGMLFVFGEDTTTGLWMKDTPLALDAAFFTAEGVLVGTLAMTPCPDEDCPVYRPAGPYRYALEVPAGGFAGLGTLRLEVMSLEEGG